MASFSLPGPPSEKTAKHCIRTSSSSSRSPNSLQIDAIDRKMIVVVIGSSTQRPGSPKNPPAVPVTATDTLCQKSKESADLAVVDLGSPLVSFSRRQIIASTK